LLYRVRSSFCRHVTEQCALLGYYAASNGNFLPSFRDVLSVPSSRFKNPFGPIGFPGTSLRYYPLLAAGRPRRAQLFRNTF